MPQPKYSGKLYRFIHASVCLTISRLNHVARRTERLRQRNTAGVFVVRPEKRCAMQGCRRGEESASLIMQTEDIHRILRASRGHRSMLSAGLRTPAGPRFRTWV